MAKVFRRLSIRNYADFERSDSRQNSKYGPDTVTCHMKKQKKTKCEDHTIFNSDTLHREEFEKEAFRETIKICIIFNFKLSCPSKNLHIMMIITTEKHRDNIDDNEPYGKW